MHICKYSDAQDGDDTKKQRELEANYFAACLLVPEHKLRQLYNATKDISLIANYFGVSRPVILLRINYLKIKANG
jgi:Zn-dependent peptidase ImmA (M78 family)